MMLLSDKQITSGTSIGDVGISCIYFLIDGAEVVYIGQTKDLPSRILQHRRDKKFNLVSSVHMDEKLVNVVESFYLHVYNPKLNKRRNGGGHVCSHTVSDILELVKLGLDCEEIKRKDTMRRAAKNIAIKKYKITEEEFEFYYECSEIDGISFASWMKLKDEI